MNLTRLFEVQRKLDAEIEKKHPTAPEEDRLSKRILALQVELGECANEWRGFKFWSNRQTSNTLYQTTCDPDSATHHYCEDCKEDVANKDTLKHFKKCEGVLYPMRAKNPLLEEYVDVIHFMLSIGLEHGRTEHRHNNEFEYGPNNVVEMFSMLFRVNWADRDNFDYFVGSIMKLGEMLGFTWDQIETAYMEKNAINHERQENGY